MPEFTVSVKGKQYTIEAPEGATQEEAQRVAEGYLSASGAAETAAGKTRQAVKPEGGRKQGERRSFLGDIAGGIGRGLSTGPEEMRQSSFLQSGGGLPSPQDDSLSSVLARSRSAIPGGSGGIGGAAESVAGTLKNPFSWMGPGGLMSKAGLGVSSGIGSYIGGELGGTPGAIAGGMAGASIPGFLGAAAKRPFRTPPERQQDVSALAGRTAGQPLYDPKLPGPPLPPSTKLPIEPTAGDVTGLPWLRKREEGGKGFWGGRSYETLTEKPITQFTQNAAASIGQRSDRLDPETLLAGKKLAQSKYKSFAEKADINHDKKLGGDFQGILKRMSDLKLHDLQANIEGAMNRILSGFETKSKGPAKMKGETMQAAIGSESDLAYLKSHGPTKYWAGLVDKALKEAIDRTAKLKKNPDIKQAYKDFEDADKLYFNYKALSKAMSDKTGLASRGLLEPQRLHTILTGTKEGKELYSTGKGDLNELTRDALKVMERPKPGTGLFEGHPGIKGGVIGGVIGTAMGHPLAGIATGLSAPGVMSRIVNSDPAQRFIKSGAQAPPRDALNWYEQMVKAGRGGLAAGVPGYAEGGIVTQPQLATVGEKGPEVIQPLSDMSPAEIAAFRMRQAVKPDTPQGMRSPGGAPSPELQGAMSTAAEVAIPGVGAYRSAKEGDYPMAAGQALAAAMPMLGAAMRGAGPALRYGAPALGAGGAIAAGTALSDTAEAGEEGLSPLEKQMLARTPKSGRPALIQKLSEQHAAERQREMEAAQRKEADAAKSAEAKAQLEKELEGLPADEQLIYRGMQPDQRAQFWAQKSEAQRQEKAAKEAEEDEKRRSELPFRERFPGLMKWMPAVAATLSGIIPYGIAARSARKGNRYINEWTQVANDFENAAKAGDLDAMLRTKNILEKYNVEHQKILKGLGKGPGAGTTLAAGTIPFDLEFLTPNAIDAAMLPPGSPGHEQAKQALTDPGEWGGRAITGFAQGMVPALVGGKVGPRLGEVPPTAQSSAAGGTYATMLKQQQAAQRAQKRATAKKKTKKLYEE